MTTPPLLLAFACLGATTALVLAERAQAPIAVRAAFKLGASSAFVALALVQGAMSSSYGHWILAALLLSWLGDAFLLSRKPPIFRAGLFSFLAAHLCFAWAFHSSGVSAFTILIAALHAAAIGALILNWLWPHLPAGDKAPVVVYVVVIMLMCVAAASYATASGNWIVLPAAVVFAISDISVARDRFIARSWHNRAWGLPLYFTAQLALAWSVTPGFRLP